MLSSLPPRAPDPLRSVLQLRLAVSSWLRHCGPWVRCFLISFIASILEGTPTIVVGLNSTDAIFENYSMKLLLACVFTPSCTLPHVVGINAHSTLDVVAARLAEKLRALTLQPRRARKECPGCRRAFTLFTPAVFGTLLARAILGTPTFTRAILGTLAHLVLLLLDLLLVVLLEGLVPVAGSHRVQWGGEESLPTGFGLVLSSP